MVTFYYLTAAPKSQNNSNSLSNKTCWLIEPYMGRSIKNIQTDELDINAPLSWTGRIQNSSKNPNLYPHQSRITYHSLLRDTLYLDSTCCSWTWWYWTTRYGRKDFKRYSGFDSITFSEYLNYWRKSLLEVIRKNNAFLLSKVCWHDPAMLCLITSSKDSRP